MENFDQQLLRLKQVLGVTSDQEVATALGLSKAAFSDRKKRGAFPEEKLYALAAKRPELRLDVLGVLVGEKKDAVVKLTLAQLEAALTFGADKGGTVIDQLQRAHALTEQMNKPLADDEQVLLDSYRRCSQEARAQLIQTAALLSAGLTGAVPPSAEKVAAKRTQTHRKGAQHYEGDGGVQIGSVAGGRVRVGKK